MFSLSRKKLLYRHYFFITSSACGSSTTPSTSFIAMSSGEQEDFLVDSGDTGTDNALVEFDWDDGFATNRLQDCSSSTRRMNSGVDRDDDDSDEVLDCVVDTMLSMVHLEGASAGAVPDGQNERAGGEEESNDEQQSNNAVSTSTEDASILKKRRGPKKVAM
jgi:hypothetical protein